MIDFLAVFITFFAVIDPIGTVPVFIAVTDKFDLKTKRRVALLAAVVSACHITVLYCYRRSHTQRASHSIICFSNIWRYCLIPICIEYDFW